MPKNVFQGQSDYVDQPNRNTFDLSFSNALSMKFGALYPVMCKEVLPGDSFKIDTQFGLQFVPTYFPLQNRINANLHFFYVRNRNLWKDWQDFIGKTKTGLQPPVVNASNKTFSDFQDMFGVGSLGDYLGIPNIGMTHSVESLPAPSLSFTSNMAYKLIYKDGVLYHEGTFSLMDFSDPNLPVIVDADFPIRHHVTNTDLYFSDNEDVKGLSVVNGVPSTLSVRSLKSDDNPNTAPVLVMFFTVTMDTPKNTPAIYHTFSIPVTIDGLVSRAGSVIASDVDRVLSLFMNKDSKGSFSSMKNPFTHPGFGIKDVQIAILGAIKQPDGSLETGVSPTYAGLIQVYNRGEYVINPVDKSDSFLNSNNISALPFRAYESIYNAFYRDQFNDPFILNGIPEYNKFLPSIEGGTDEEVYTLHYRNWEKDVFTTCKQTPQQGNAPLVGVTVVGDFQFKDNDGNIHIVKPKYGADGKTIESVNFEEKTPSEVRNSMIDLITSGFTINDFRNVNALQRWLETNIRRGFRYKDQIMSHFGVDTRFDTLDMPEFIGGMSRTVSVNMVTNLAASDRAPLGDYAGQLYCNGDAGHSVSKYCDEHGFIIGILSVTPVPVYSQVLPKHFLKRDPMDYYFPEFAHIGMTPLPYSELDPQGQYVKNPEKMDEIFGYQRAWYEYLSSIDESHGEFKTTLRNFLMQRYFANPPVLGHDFLQVKPDEINDVFINTENNDKIIGQLRFNIMAKRPIPRFGIPKLEA